MTTTTARQERQDASTVLWRRWTEAAGSPPSALAPQYAGLTSAEDLAARQDGANREAEARARRSSMAGLTLRTALEDVREAVVGVPADVYGQSGPLSLAALLAKNDRLRGLGLLLLLLALLSLAVL